MKRHLIDLAGAPPRAERTHGAEPRAARPWYRIANLSADTVEVSIFDEIGWFGITAADFARDLEAVAAQRITLRLNSPGGDVFDGVAIYNALARHPATVDVVVDGLAASIASVIAMSGDTIAMSAAGRMMIHDALTLTVGNAAELRATADLLDSISSTIADVYAARAGGTADEWRARMVAETWFTADEARTAGLIDSVVPLKGADDGDSAPADRWDLSVFARRPAAVAPVPAVVDTAIAVHHTATEDSPWDGPAAVSAMPAEAATLRYCHAWRDPDGDPDAKGTYKFPHHRREGGPANLPACRNGLARLSSADIPDGDRDGVRRHLQAHLDDAGDGGDSSTEDSAGPTPAGTEPAAAPVFDMDLFRRAVKGAQR